MNNNQSQENHNVVQSENVQNQALVKRLALPKGIYIPEGTIGKCGAGFGDISEEIYEIRIPIYDDVVRLLIPKDIFIQLRLQQPQIAIL